MRRSIYDHFYFLHKKEARPSLQGKGNISGLIVVQGGWKYAESLNPDAIYILSAKYGLLRPDDIIAPYEQTLNAAKDAQIRKWSIMVAGQIQRAGIDRSQKAIFLCGKNYRKYIKNLFKNCSAPCAHLSIGKQMQFFNSEVK